MVNKDLTNMIEACENMPCCYKEYVALGKNIDAVTTFKEYVYLKYGFWPHNVDEYYSNTIKPSTEESNCSTSLSKEEEEGTKFKIHQSHLHVQVL